MLRTNYILIPKPKSSSKVQTPSSCVFLDLSNSGLSNAGCEIATDKSNSSMTTCQCRHLTNFGVILDFTDRAPVDGLGREIVSYVCLMFSIVSILITQLVIYYVQR